MRLKTMIIFGAGYLWGTRAGRDRYKEIAESVRTVAESEVVQGYVNRAMDLAKRPLVGAVPGAAKTATGAAKTATGATKTGTEATGDVTETAGDVGEKVTKAGKAAGSKAGGSSSARQSTSAGGGR